MNRRQFLVSGGSVLGLALAPAAEAATPVAPFVPPTTNIVHLAGRIGQKCLFTADDLLRLLGLDSTSIKTGECEATPHEYDDDYARLYYDRMEKARSLAEEGAHDVYKRAQLVISIKRKMNLHFNFARDEQVFWLNQPNPHLKGMTFRQVMKFNLPFAAKTIDLALEA